MIRGQKTAGDDMAQNEPTLPHFERPPVSEVALSVEFAPLGDWKLSNVVKYWQAIQDEYPDIQVQPELPPAIENFDQGMLGQQQFVRFGGPPEHLRFWLVGNPPANLMQIQRDRFIVNWRKVSGQEIYPRYAREIRPRFVHQWSNFQAFLSGHGLGSPTVLQCEVTYINDIVRGDGWNSIDDLPQLLTSWSGKRSGNYLPSLESLNLGCSFLMVPENGRLYVTVQHLKRAIDSAEVIQIRLFARGKPQSGNDTDVMKCMDLCHEWIVRGFTDITSEPAHKRWERRT